MLPVPLTYLLLCAIAFGQIFGTLSCCCLSRAIASTVGTVLSSDANHCSIELVTEARCERCGKSSSASQACSHDDEAAGWGEAFKCSCAKVVSGLGTKAQSFSVDQIELSNLALPIMLSPGIFQAVKFRNVVESMYGSSRHSWQSIACTWRN